MKYKTCMYKKHVYAYIGISDWLIIRDGYKTLINNLRSK